MERVAKPKKQRADEYGTKRTINTTFDDVTGLSLHGSDDAVNKNDNAKKEGSKS